RYCLSIEINLRCFNSDFLLQALGVRRRSRSYCGTLRLLLLPMGMSFLLCTLLGAVACPEFPTKVGLSTSTTSS
ncbi:hypothetical protein HAX54_044345, partial [Datura stramonium]|nr:hypothetical protein [Datura stramonium]